MDYGEKVCKKIDFWIGKAVKKLKKMKKYVILYVENNIYIVLSMYILFFYIRRKRAQTVGIKRNFPSYQQREKSHTVGDGRSAWY